MSNPIETNSTLYFRGYRIADRYRSCTVWMFSTQTGKLISTMSRACATRLSIEDRQHEIRDFLKSFGLSEP